MGNGSVRAKLTTSKSSIPQTSNPSQRSRSAALPTSIKPWPQPRAPSSRTRKPLLRSGWRFCGGSSRSTRPSLKPWPKLFRRRWDVPFLSHERHKLRLVWGICSNLKVLEQFKFEDLKGSTLMRKEPIGVCGLITPWNWPMNQVVAKVAPALAAGCTMVLKPSEIAPLSAYLFAEILHEAGTPPGIFNLVNGDGPTVGRAISSHPDVAMVSFTGSTRAGIAVALAAAPTVKRVTQELGGKSAHIILDDADLDGAVKEGVQACFRNTGQSCNAPTRMLVPRSKMAQAIAAAKKTADATQVGEPSAEATHMGPLASKAQFEKVQRLIAQGIEVGANLIAGGPGRPEGINPEGINKDKGYFVKPTVFADVSNEMTVAREEIFGPVLCMIPYEDEDDAVRIANDTPYGLSGFVSSADLEHARRVAKRIRSGNVHINNARVDFAGCFGGYKQSGNGREWGEAGLEEFLELKSIFGYASRAK